MSPGAQQFPHQYLVMFIYHILGYLFFFFFKNDEKVYKRLGSNIHDKCFLYRMHNTDIVTTVGTLAVFKSLTWMLITLLIQIETVFFVCLFLFFYVVVVCCDAPLEGS